MVATAATGRGAYHYGDGGGGGGHLLQSDDDDDYSARQQEQQPRLPPQRPERRHKPLKDKKNLDVPLDPFPANFIDRDNEDNEDSKGQLSCGADLQSIGNNVLRASVKVAEAHPPPTQQQQPQPQERILRTEWQGAPVTYMDYRCPHSDPNPRLFVTDLNDLQYRRSLHMDTRYPEPPSRRQAHVQLLTDGFRNRRDIYTVASATNDLSRLSCRRLQEEAPKFSGWPSKPSRPTRPTHY